MLKMVDCAIKCQQGMLFIFYFLKNVTASIGCCMHTSSRPLKLGSNFREICLARRVSTARSPPYMEATNAQPFKFQDSRKSTPQEVLSGLVG